MDVPQAAKDAASDIKSSLGSNHKGTMMFHHFIPHLSTKSDDVFPIFVVVDRFDQNSAKNLTDVAKQYHDKGIDGPFVVTYKDLRGMADSVPEEILEVTMGYELLEGIDVLASLPKPDMEHLRAQSELAIRRYLYNLRWTLLQALRDQSAMDGYLHNLLFYSLFSIRMYHHYTQPEINNIEEHFDAFFQEFPEAKEGLMVLMKHILDGEPLDRDPAEISTLVLSTTFEPLLKSIDEKGDPT